MQPPSQESIVHASPSSQLIETYVHWPLLQESVVQGLLSSQLIGCPLHCPLVGSHVNGKQAVELTHSIRMLRQSPVSGSHISEVQGLRSSQLTREKMSFL